MIGAYTITQEYKQLTSTSVRLFALASPEDKDDIEVVFRWRKVGEEYVAENISDRYFVDSTTQLYIDISGLEPDQEYEYESVAYQTGTGTPLGTGGGLFFTTNPLRVQTLPASRTSDTVFNLKGNIVDVGDAESIRGYFAWKPEDSDTWNYEDATGLLELEEREPQEIDNMLIWCDASENVTVDSANKVSNWGDKSTENNDLIQQWAYKPELDTGVIKFRTDGSLHSNPGPYPYNMEDQNPVLTESFTLFTVARCPTVKRTMLWTQWRDGETNRIIGEAHAGGDSGYLSIWINGTEHKVDAGITTADYHIITWQKDRDNFLKVFVDGVEKLNVTTNIPFGVLQKSFCIGQRTELGGVASDIDYKYILGYSEAIGEDDRQSIEKFLSDKFTIPITETATSFSLPINYNGDVTITEPDKRHQFKSLVYDDVAMDYIAEGDILYMPGKAFTDRLVAPHTIEDNNDTYAYNSMRIDKDFSTIKNHVTVGHYIDILGEEFFQSTTEEDSESQLLYGKREYFEIIESPQSWFRAKAILEKYKKPSIKVAFKTYKSGFKSGQLLNINSVSRGLDDTFIIEEVTHNTDTQGTFVYTVRATNYKPTELLDYIKRL